MKAIVLRVNGDPSVLRLEEWPDPQPQPHEVVVKVGAVGVPYHDIVERNGVLRPGHGLPKILGNEIAGTVVALGSGVAAPKIGARVCSKGFHSCGECRRCRNGNETLCSRRRVVSGGYAEYVAIPAEALVEIPDTISFAEACMLGSSTAVALNALRDIAQVRLGASVLVTGASGGVGLPALQIAKAAGANVIAMTHSPAKGEALAEGGARHVVVAENGRDFSDDVRKLTGDDGVDIVIDTVGSKVFAPAFRSLATGGRYVVVGQLTRDEVALNLARIIFKAATISGVTSARRDQLEDVVGLVAAGRLRSQIAKIMPLSQAAEAHALVESGGIVGRVVLQP